MVNKKNTRLDYIDNLKLLLTIQVIIFHVSIAFGDAGMFIIETDSRGSSLFNTLNNAFLGFSQSYFMGLFFCISAIFSFMSLRKKGRSKFLKNKFKRLFMPAVIYYLLVSPVILFISDFFRHKSNFSDMELSFNMGPLWFLIVLFMFDFVFAYVSENLLINKPKGLPKMKYIIGGLIITSILTFLVRLVFPVGYFLPILGFQPAHLIQYIYAYSIGVLISRYRWLDAIEGKSLDKLLLVIVPVFGLMLIVVSLVSNEPDGITTAYGGMNFYSALYSFFDQSMFIIMLLGLISLFQKRFNVKNALLRYMSKNAFGAYITHSFVIVVIVIVLNNFDLSHNMNFLITILASCSLSFSVGSLLAPILK